MRILQTIFFILCFVVLFTACRKEMSVENGSTEVRGLLVKAVGITGSDTLTTIYTYDNKSRLETETSDGKFGNEPLHFYRRYTRDFTTRITQITEQSLNREWIMTQPGLMCIIQIRCTGIRLYNFC